MRSRRGATIIELLIYMFILVILMGVLGTVLANAQKALEVNRMDVQVQSSAQTALARITSELRDSSLQTVGLIESGLTDEGVNATVINYDHVYLNFSNAGIVFTLPYVSGTHKLSLPSTASDMPWESTISANPHNGVTYVCYYVGNSPGLPQDLASLISPNYSKALYRCEFTGTSPAGMYQSGWSGVPVVNQIRAIGTDRTRVMGFPRILIADHLATRGLTVGGDQNIAPLSYASGGSSIEPIALFFEPYSGTFAVDGFRAAIRHHKIGTDSTASDDVASEFSQLDIAIAVATPGLGSSTSQASFNVVCASAETGPRN